MRIREAGPQDWDRVAELTVAAYVDGGFLTADDPYVDHLTDVRRRAEDSTLLVAEVAELAGAARTPDGFCPFEGPGAPDDGGALERPSTPERAVGNGAVVASVAVTEAGGPLAEVSRPGEIEFRMLAVAPEHQGRGVARTMVRHIVDSAQRRPDITAVTLCSLRTMTAAHTLYRSEGFVEDPERDFVITEETHGKDARFPFFIRQLRSPSAV